MAGYGYKVDGNGYSQYHSSVSPFACDRKKTSYLDDDDDYFDHHGHYPQRQLEDNDLGKKKQPNFFRPPGTYVTTKETIIEEVETRPTITQYMMDPKRNYHGGMSCTTRPLSYVQNQRPPEVEELITKIQTQVNPSRRVSPTRRVSPQRITYQHRIHDSPDHGYGGKDYKDDRNDGYDHCNYKYNNGHGHKDRKDEDGRDTYGYGHGEYKDNDPCVTYGYGEQDYENGHRHKGNGPRCDASHYYNGNNYIHEPPRHTGGCRSPTTSSYGAPARSVVTIVKPPTNNVGAAPNPRFRVGVPVAPRKETVIVETINIHEAAGRYNGAMV